jgi:ribosomal protein S12 methylthiotransferase accessory factor
MIPLRTPALRAIGPVAGLVDLPAQIEDDLCRWGITGMRPTLRLFRPIPELAGHTFVVSESTGPPKAVNAAGCARAAADAVRSCIGELVERTALRTWAPPEQVRASASALKRRDLHVFPVPDYVGQARFPRRWPFAPYDDDRELTWVEGEELPSRRPMWVPASLVRLTARDEPEALVEGSSVGTAAGANCDDATLAATLELIERDAVMHAWNEGWQLDRSSGPERMEAECQASDRTDWVTYQLTARSRLGPAVAVAFTLDRTRHIYGIGASAAPDASQRRDHALAEAIMTRVGVVLGGRRKIGSRLRLEDHLSYYCTQPRLMRLERLLVGPITKSPQTKVTLDDVLTGFAREGIVVVRVLLWGGRDRLCVVRVLATRLYTMEADVACARVPPGAAVVSPYHVHPYT